MKNSNGLLAGSLLFFGLFFPQGKLFSTQIPFFAFLGIILCFTATNIKNKLSTSDINTSIIIISGSILLFIISLIHGHEQIFTIATSLAIILLAYHLDINQISKNIALKVMQIGVLIVFAIAFLQFLDVRPALLAPLTMYQIFNIPITPEIYINSLNYPTGISGVPHIFYYSCAVSVVFFGKFYFDFAQKNKQDALNTLCLISSLAMVIICAQRASIIGLLFGLMLLSTRRASKMQKNIYSVPIIAICTVALLYLASTIYSSSFLYRFDYKFADFFFSNSDSIRLESIRAGVSAFLENPYIGTKFQYFNSIIAPHNGFINGLAHFGIIYFLIIAIMIFLVSKTLKNNSWVIVPWCLCFFTLMTHSSIPFYNDVIFALVFFIIVFLKNKLPSTSEK